jgi:hypothetical protein
MPLPRGIRNNNPLNLRENKFSDFNWVGEAKKDWDPEFEEFSHAVFGLRAAAKIILLYQRKHKLETLSEIIARWAPPIENDTGKYTNFVANKVKIDPNQPLFLKNSPVLLVDIMAAMIFMECGQNPYDKHLIRAGVELALSSWNQPA